MILSASRRCDLPAFGLDRLKESFERGEITVRNPFNAAQSRVLPLNHEAVEGIVFWSKDPSRLLDADWLEPYPFYVQYTLNAYDSDIEPSVPPITQRIETARHIAKNFGTDALCPRYDPILFYPRFDMQRHIEAFTRIIEELWGYASHVTVSFLDLYPRIQKRMDSIQAYTPDQAQRAELLCAFADIARRHGMQLFTCAEADGYPNVFPGKCIDAERLSRIAGRPIVAPKDKNQRPNCGCDQAVDIGSYGKCAHGCLYCYASR